MTSNMLRPQIPELNWKNYSKCSRKKMLQYSQELWEMGLQNNRQKTISSGELNEMRIKDPKALAFIY